VAAQLPAGLDPFTRRYPAAVAEALDALGVAVSHFRDSQFELVLKALPDQARADATVIADYALIYRGFALLQLERAEEAAVVFDRLRIRFPGSPLIPECTKAEARAWIEAGNADRAMAALERLGGTEDAELLYWRGRAHELADRRSSAVEDYLRVYCEFVTAPEAALAQKRLAALSPSYLTRAAHLPLLLRRARRLIDYGRNQDARTLLARLTGIPAADVASRESRWLLMVRANLGLRRYTESLSLLQRIGSSDPERHAEGIYLRGSVFRRQGDEKRLLAARERAVTIHPQSRFTEEFIYSTATYFDVRYDAERARESYQLLLRLFPRGSYSSRASWKLAVVAFARARYDEALRYFSEHLDGDSDTDPAAALYWMARCYEPLGERAKAAWLYRRARELGNHSYYGLLSEAAASAMGSATGTLSGITAGVDFAPLMRRLTAASLDAARIAAPSASAAAAIERASQLIAAGMSDSAIEELEWTNTRSSGEGALGYVMALIHARGGDHLNSIIAMRREFPQYLRLSPASLPDEVWELLFPVKYWETIVRASSTAKLDPNLVLGLIRQESAFQLTARSRANARGLMQILPTTGRALAQQARLRQYSTSRLYQADTNITLGTRHLAALLRRYDNKAELALAAYNAGENRVDRWVQELGKPELPVFVELIPLSETRGYVKQVLTNQAHYRLRTASASGESR